MAKVDFNPERDIPDMSGKVILVTGGTSGVGRETILYLLAHNPAHILFTGRKKAAAETLINDCSSSHPKTKLTFIPCDLSSLASVKSGAQTILSSVDRLDLLFCIAGVMALGCKKSTDGYEIQFATNHLGHALLIKQLLPLLQQTVKQPLSPSSASADVRIIITSSQAVSTPLVPSTGIEFDRLKTEQPMFAGSFRRYAQSKLANLIYARGLGSHHPDIVVTAVHPGIAYTGLQNSFRLVDRFVMWSTTIGRTMPVNQLAWNGLWCATAPRDEVVQGAYYEPVAVKIECTGVLGDKELEDKLWQWTETELAAWK